MNDPKSPKNNANNPNRLSFPLFPNRINLVGKQGKDHPRATPSTLGNSAQWLVLDQHDLANSRSMLVFSLGFILLCIKLYSKPRFPKETNKPEVINIVWEEF